MQNRIAPLLMVVHGCFVTALQLASAVVRIIIILRYPDAQKDRKRKHNTVISSPWRVVATHYNIMEREGGRKEAPVHTCNERHQSANPRHCGCAYTRLLAVSRATCT